MASTLLGIKGKTSAANETDARTDKKSPNSKARENDERENRTVENVFDVILFFLNSQ